MNSNISFEFFETKFFETTKMSNNRFNCKNSQKKIEKKQNVARNFRNENQIWKNNGKSGRIHFYSACSVFSFGTQDLHYNVPHFQRSPKVLFLKEEVPRITPLTRTTNFRTQLTGTACEIAKELIQHTDPVSVVSIHIIIMFLKFML